MWTIRIYGTDTNGGTTVSKAFADANFDFVEMDVLAVQSAPSVEAEPIVDISGNVVSNHFIRAGFEIISEPLSLPSTAQNLQSFYSTEVFNKAFHYLWFGGYPLPDEDVTSPECLAVAIKEISVEHDFEIGAKQFKISLEKREVE